VTTCLTKILRGEVFQTVPLAPGQTHAVPFQCVCSVWACVVVSEKRLTMSRIESRVLPRTGSNDNTQGSRLVSHAE
jgi:hypothetical protein